MTSRIVLVCYALCSIIPGSVAFGQNSLDSSVDTSKLVVRKPTFESTFQASLFYRISTNGHLSADYINRYSLNLIGVSAGNRVIEVGVLVNENIQGVSGFQFAGLTNLVGKSAFKNLSVSEERALIHSGFESNVKGFQAAGVLNYVRNHVSGFQLAGGFNSVGRDQKGIQVAGLGNSTGGDGQGLQIASLYNITHGSETGIQISALFNMTQEQLTGIQIALINRATVMKGSHTTPRTKQPAFQFGLVNSSQAMDGWQFGLVNFSKGFRGKQIGLVNFFPKYGSKELVRMGTPIGLLNFRSRGSILRFNTNEVFTINMEYTTGNCLNCTWTQSGMPIADGNLIYNQNALIVGIDPVYNTWGFGYGFQKVLYNKSSMLPTDRNNRKRIITYGVKFLHLNKEKKLDPSFNLLTRFNFDIGIRKWPGYWFAGMSLNYFAFEPEEVNSDAYHIRSTRFPAGNPFGLIGEFWPGYTLGMQF